MAIPARRSIADRRPSLLWDGLVVLLVLLAALLVWRLALPSSRGGHFSVSIQSDQLCQNYDQDMLSTPITLTVPGPYPLTVRLSQTGVSVIDHACPDGDCARVTLTPERPGQIICLPNRTLIRLSTHEAPPFDAVTG